MSEEILSEEDLQCSDLLNSNTSWGARDVPAMLTNDRLNPYTLGQFIWAGIIEINVVFPQTVFQEIAHIFIKFHTQIDIGKRECVVSQREETTGQHIM